MVSRTLISLAVFRPLLTVQFNPEQQIRSDQPLPDRWNHTGVQYEQYGVCADQSVAPLATLASASHFHLIRVQLLWIYRLIVFSKYVLLFKRIKTLLICSTCSHVTGGIIRRKIKYICFSRSSFTWSCSRRYVCIKKSHTITQGRFSVLENNPLFLL